MTLAIVIVAIGLGIFFGKKMGLGPLSDFPADSEYDKHKEGEWTVFDVTPARAPRNISFFLYIGGMSLLLAAIVEYGIGARGVGSYIVAPVLIFAIWWGLLRDARPRGYKSKSSFRVSPTQIQKGGKTFNKDDIHRLVAPNGMNREMTVIISSQHSASYTAGVQNTLNHRAAVQEYAYGLAVEAKGKRDLLAGGLTETTAFALLSDASEILGLELKD